MFDHVIRRAGQHYSLLRLSRRAGQHYIVLRLNRVYLKLHTESNKNGVGISGAVNGNANRSPPELTGREVRCRIST
jgi:hypothetical protein